jgi:hypothetical protein
MASFSAAQLVALVFSSSVLAALISLAGNHVLAQLQFKRDYFKEIIGKRLNAYQQVDELIGILRMTTYDDSGRIAHALFLNKAIYERATFIAAAAVGLSLYLSESIRDTLSKVNFILLKLPQNASEGEAFDIGVAERDALSELRQKLEHLVAADLLELYKVRRFLKTKRRLAGTPTRRFLAWLPKHGGFSFGRGRSDQ